MFLIRDFTFTALAGRAARVLPFQYPKFPALGLDPASNELLTQLECRLLGCCVASFHLLSVRPLGAKLRRNYSHDTHTTHTL